MSKFKKINMHNFMVSWNKSLFEFLSRNIRTAQPMHVTGKQHYKMFICLKVHQSKQNTYKVINDKQTIHSL